MDRFLSFVVKAITESVKDVKGIVLKGSRQTEALVDIWSDYDLEVVLKPGAAVCEQEALRAADRIGLVVGSEIYRHGEHAFLYRTAIEYESQIYLLDMQLSAYTEWIAHQEGPFTVLYGELELGEAVQQGDATGHDPFASYEYEAVWFKYFIAIKRLARHDYLIGLHLLLDLVREYLVVVMIERDAERGTTIHRHGYGERLPAAMDLTLLDTSDPVKVFDFIANVAYEYDNKLVRYIKGYASRYEQVAGYIEQTKRFAARK
ncbi:hypothetical protein [Paenibacillus ginsengarvi]|uniref:Nucleotidyltransferase domain-containing protein n=1 Tax=Paenibacillus ginsengarvi TaxID=400777 RepID=A0A3B0CIY0_9BACL|nr:hypothetical protein [Paenibacillus ginsengarvi]RKN83936.1 hypothetical protein D7M11_15250 [Paenibacillus ginsengarvi]